MTTFKTYVPAGVIPACILPFHDDLSLDLKSFAKHLNDTAAVDGLSAIGDITAPPWLAHKASHEGVIAAEAIAGKHPHAMDVRNIPGCTYCHPQIASVGLTEAKAKEAGYAVKVGTFPFIGNGKAIALGEAEGFIKTVFDARTGELLGAHMIGAEVTELIQGYTVGKTLETTEAELIETVFPHPVFHGDTIRVETTVISVRESKSNPDRGIVEFEHRAYNQNDVLVAKCLRQAMMLKRPAA